MDLRNDIAVAQRLSAVSVYLLRANSNQVRMKRYQPLADRATRYRCTMCKKFVRKEEQSMSLNHIIESWRDDEYRESLDAETRSLLPENPAGEIELTDEELATLDGGAVKSISATITLTVTITWTWTWTYGPTTE
jgi:mersacidin/lichenicidin family type 2 lantibiotic